MKDKNIGYYPAIIMHKIFPLKYGYYSIVSFVLTSLIFVSSAFSQDSLWIELTSKYKDYYRDGRYLDALETAKKALEVAEKTFGLEHNKYATSLTNLGYAYWSQAKYTEAERLYKEALSIKVNTSGPDHPDIVSSLHNLAHVYHKLGKYTEAENLHKRGLAIREKTVGSEHPDTAVSLNYLSLLFKDQGRYPEAEKLQRKALAIREKNLDPEHLDIAMSLNNLATVLRSMAKYSEAESLFNRAIDIRKKVQGTEHPIFAWSLNELALLYKYIDRKSEAERLFKQALAIRRKILGLVHPDVAWSLNNLALLYTDQSKYSEAEPLFHQAIVMYETTLGSNHPYVALAVSGLGNLYNTLGKYSEAELLFKRVLAIRKTNFGLEHPEVAQAMNDLARTYHKKGEYSRADSLFKRALSISEKVIGFDHPDIAKNSNNIALLNKAQGKYSVAELLHKQALAMYEKTLGFDHPNVALCLNNLASLFIVQGEYSKAEPYYERALAISENAYGMEHPDVAWILNRLGELYIYQKKYSKAEPHYVQALDIRMKIYGLKHPDVAWSLKNLGLLYSTEKKYSEADSLFKLSIEIYEETLGPDHAYLALPLYGLASLNYNLKKYFEAETYYNRALEVRKNALGSEHPYVAVILANLAVMYKEQGYFLKALKLSKEAVSIIERNRKSFIKEETAVSFQSKYYSQNEFLVELLYDLAEKTRDPSYLSESFTFAERGKSQVFLNMLNESEIDIRKGTTSELRVKEKELTVQLSAAQKKIFREKDLSERERLTRLRNDLDEQYQDLMWEMRINNPEYADLKTIKSIEIEVLQKQVLRSNEVMLEYFYTGDKYLLFFISRDKFSAHALQPGINDKVKELHDKMAFFKDRYSKEKKMPEYFMNLSNDLFEKLLGPVKNDIHGKDLIIIPDNYMHYFPFEMLVTRMSADSGRFLIEDYAVGYIQSATVFAEMRKKETRLYSMDLIGFGDPYSDLDNETQQIRGHWQVESAEEDSVWLDLNPLKYAKEEVEKISGYFPEEKVKIYLGKDALESILKANRSSSSRFLHFATHGILNQNKPQFSGLALFPGGNEDGFLQTFEIFNLELNADLTVLSACQTGLGKLVSGEGFIGLTRAFMYAGSRNLIVSLWAINDRSTSQFMDALYQNISNGLSYEEAVRQAKLLFIKSDDYAFPYYWAPFIFVGAN